MSPLYHVNISSQTSMPMCVCACVRLLWGQEYGSWRLLRGLCMEAGFQDAGRPVAIINDSDRLDLTHSITLCLTHHQLIYHADTWQPHPRLTCSPTQDKKDAFWGLAQHFGTARQPSLSLHLLFGYNHNVTVEVPAWPMSKRYMWGMLFLFCHNTQQNTIWTAD